MSLQAYRDAQIQTQDPRQLEYLLFAEITRDLIAENEKGDRISLSRVLHRNLQLWQALRADCTSDDNRMPKEIRAGIISLSIWVENHSRDVRRNLQIVEPLIRVNKTIMEGLKPQIATAAA